MKSNAWWGGLTSLGQVCELLSYVLEIAASAPYWAPKWALGQNQLLQRELFALLMACSTGDKKDLKGHSDSVVRAAKARTIPESDFELIWQIRQMVKKFEFGCSMTPDQACESFLVRNQALAKTSPLPEELRITMRQLLARVLPCPPDQTGGYSKFLSEGRFGPGAIKEGGATYVKKLACATEFLKAHGYPFWFDKALDVTSTAAKLQAVPKDAFKLRTITVEPMTRAWFQQATRTTILRSIHMGPLRGSILDQSLHETGFVDCFEVWRGRGPKRSEPRQKLRCRLGARKGRLATIDLSNASDTIRYDDVMSVFPAWLAWLLDEVRSPQVEWNGEVHQLNMYAGMGNATTFPVETLFFWALLTAVANIRSGYRTWEPQRLNLRAGSVTVYGDDIVCTDDLASDPWASNYVRRSTTIEVNEEKSGMGGPGFREACGEVSYLSVSLPFTYRMYGASQDKAGAARYCDLASRYLNSDRPEFNLIGYALATWKGAPKAPFVITDEAHAAIAYRRPEVDNFWSQRLASQPLCRAPKQRWNSKLQRFEVKLQCVRAYERSVVVGSGGKVGREPIGKGSNAALPSNASGPRGSKPQRKGTNQRPCESDIHNRSRRDPHKPRKGPTCVGGDPTAWEPRIDYVLGLLGQGIQSTGESAKRILRMPLPRHTLVRYSWVPGQLL
jgi:hypothetical protein